jgi:hypothetical protein
MQSGKEALRRLQERFDRKAKQVSGRTPKEERKSQRYCRRIPRKTLDNEEGKTDT